MKLTPALLNQIAKPLGKNQWRLRFGPPNYNSISYHPGSGSRFWMLSGTAIIPPTLEQLMALLYHQGKIDGASEVRTAIHTALGTKECVEPLIENTHEDR